MKTLLPVKVLSLAVLCALFVPRGGSSLLAAETAQRLSTGWEYYQGSLGSAWEVWRGDAASDNVAWTPVTLPHCFWGRGTDTFVSSLSSLLLFGPLL